MVHHHVMPLTLKPYLDPDKNLTMQLNHLNPGLMSYTTVPGMDTIVNRRLVQILTSFFNEFTIDQFNENELNTFYVHVSMLRGVTIIIHINGLPAYQYVSLKK